jgi:signal transduction histidine kinase
LAKANAVLEQNVRDRTAKLQETITELERFSYALTHDIRAPLRAMSGYSDLLLQDCGAQLEEAHRDLLRRIATAAVRMDSLVTDALQYHRAINSEFELKPVDVTKLLRDMVEAYPQFQSPRAKVTVAEDIPTILGNEGSLIQCFSNLLNNAVKFVRPDAVPEINVWAERTGDRVRLWFQDNGIGIAPEYHERVWTLFERLNTSYEGTGLGLAVVRKLVERMRGNTGVESTAGEGSRFWIELSAA